MYAAERTPYYGPFGAPDSDLGPFEELRGQDLIGFDRIQVLETNLPNNILGLERYDRLQQDIFTYSRFVTNADGNLSPVYVRVSAGTTITMEADLMHWIEAMQECNDQLLAETRDWFRCSTDPNSWVNCPIAANGVFYVDGMRNEMLPTFALDDFLENVEQFLGVEDDPVPDEFGTLPTRDEIWSLFRYPPPSPEEWIDRLREDIALRGRNPIP